MEELKEKGFIKTHRSGTTGIGKTLEDLLGIQENNVQGPDFATYELKSARKNAASMVTLFTKTPQPKGVIGTLLKTYGYPPRNKPSEAEDEVIKQPTLPKFMGLSETKHPPISDERILHSTVDALKPNSMGFMIDLEEKVIHVKNKKNIECFYTELYVQEAFQKKYSDRLIVVEAEHKDSKEEEKFWFNTVKLYAGFEFNRFYKLIADGIIKLDLRIGQYPDGRPHDHGTGFRAYPRHLEECFTRVEIVMQ
jgi:hypothetical protein